MTFLDELRAEAEDVRKNASRVLAVPGSKFAIRFRPHPDREKLSPLIAAYRIQGALTGEQEKQLIIDCCDEIVRRPPDDDPDKAEPVDPEGGPLQFDASDDRWPDECKTARECVAYLFKLDQRPLAASGAVDELMDWLQGLNDEAVRRAEGKSASTEDSSETPPEST